ncbi:MAG: riboflavin synthase [Thermoanaerobaculia bacterium]
MFTGIVSGVGRVGAVERRRGGGLRLTIASPARYGRFAAGESVCVSGVCLTAVASDRRLIADLSSETLSRTTLGDLEPGAPVNLERALRWGDRLSGHFVMGHVDGISRVLSIARAGNSWTFRFSIPPGLAGLIAPKGSVALDGVSLTVASRRSRSFAVAVIPETHRRTSLGTAAPGTRVNFECDIFARYERTGALRRVRRIARRR